MNLLVRCDAIDVGLHVPPRSAQLAYLDPPFGIGTSFGARAPRRQAGARAGARRETSRTPIAGRRSRRTSSGSSRASRPSATASAADGTMWLAPRSPRRAREQGHLRSRLRIQRRSSARSSGRRATARAARGAGPATTHQTLLLYARRAGLRLERARSEPARAVRRDEPLDALQPAGRRRDAGIASEPSPARRTATTPTRVARSAASGPTARR